MTTTTQAAPTIRERVADGAAWLDQNHPDWPAAIDLDQLAMEHCHRCILGQVLGDYYKAPLELDQAVALGFDVDCPSVDYLQRLAAVDAQLDARAHQQRLEFAALATEWTRVVQVRRGEVACCPCTDLVCDPGCDCDYCPHDESELTDDDD